ncbi:chromate transporter [Alteribacillus iranensis]|uniref:Chromate transporter n=1 Tax=Alteribacillus iranensis TaxID=930128 RepID=A0A1I2C0J8_9BACI|nr:chromate transporter [Alteribacillus iranensis]SFE61712.1 chromate transporter [Alteribacillus iranensis]
MQLKIFLAFFRVGLLGYGGGPASIPLVHKEVVDHYQWVSEEEFGDILALGNTLPGPIVTKMAGYIGYAKGGIIGALNGVLAVMMPTIILMISLFAVLSAFQEEAWVNGITNGVLPVVTVMMGVLTWGFIKKSKQDFGWKIVGVALAAGLLLIELFHIHPAIIIAVLLLIAIFQKSDTEKKEKLRKEGEAK